MREKIDYPFSNQIIFAKVMENEEICIPFLERIFRGRKIKQAIITEKLALNSEVTLQPDSPKARGIRLDVLFEDENAWYDIEMQVEKEPHLSKRCRYYKSVLDSKSLKKGEDYKYLKKAFIIFICKFDYFKRGEPIYFFENYDVKNSLPLNDESYTIIVNTTSMKLDIEDEVKYLFDYINTGAIKSEDNLINKIHSEVMRLQNDEEVHSIMTFEEEYEIRIKRAEEEGRRLNAIESALSMKKDGIPIEKIAEYTKLSIEEIEKM